MDLPFDSLELARHPVLYSVAATALAVVGGVVLIAAVRRRPSPAELEQRRRQMLAEQGRIVDGTLTGAAPSPNAPATVYYTYRVAGVTYECSQDVSGLYPRVQHLRLDFPVQVRYLRENPGNSIVVEESWNGLWSAVKDEETQHRLTL
jgi:hypothetical protein